MNRRQPDGPAPVQPFFSTPAQRLALARQRYFEEGIRPSGLVGEGVIQSWSRCVQAHRDPVEAIAFNPVTRSRIHSVLAQSRQLLEAATGDLEQLERVLADTPCTAILTDPHGVVVHATRPGAERGEVLLPLARRVGVSLDEAHIGTGAPGVTLRTGQPSLVLGGEHFFGRLQAMHCAAAPIRDVHGEVAAVLDLSTESQPFGFDAAAIVGLYATSIENQLLRTQSTGHVVVHLQTSPALLGTPLEGLAGLDTEGRIVWLNNVAARLLGVVQGSRGLRADATFGVDGADLTRLTRAGRPTPHRLPSGLQVWLAAVMQARDGAARIHGPARVGDGTEAPTRVASTPISPVPAAVTLRDTDREAVARTLQACRGNVSQAARRLGVSRGLIYRHLKRTSQAGPG